MIYDPPQFRWNFLLHNVPLRCCFACDACTYPVCAPCVVCASPFLPWKVFSIQEDSLEWAAPFFRNINASVPKEMIGIYWMQDNVFPESLVAIHSNPFDSNGEMTLKVEENWSKYATLAGCFLQNTARFKCWSQTAAIQRDGMNLKIKLSDGWLVQTPSLVSKEDSPVPFDPNNDFVRFSYKNKRDETDGVTYQYRMRKIVGINKQNEIVPLPALTEYLNSIQNTEQTFLSSGCCSKSREFRVQMCSFPNNQAMKRV